MCTQLNITKGDFIYYCIASFDDPTRTQEAVDYANENNIYTGLTTASVEQKVQYAVSDVGAR